MCKAVHVMVQIFTQQSSGLHHEKGCLAREVAVMLARMPQAAYAVLALLAATNVSSSPIVRCLSLCEGTCGSLIRETRGRAVHFVTFGCECLERWNAALCIHVGAQGGCGLLARLQRALTVCIVENSSKGKRESHRHNLTGVTTRGNTDKSQTSQTFPSAIFANIVMVDSLAIAASLPTRCEACKLAVAILARLAIIPSLASVVKLCRILKLCKPRNLGKCCKLGVCCNG